MKYFLRHLSNIQNVNNQVLFNIYIYIYIYLDCCFLFKINDTCEWLSLEKGIGKLNEGNDVNAGNYGGNAGNQRVSDGNAENQSGNVGN